MFDINGREIFTGEENNALQYEHHSTLPSGIYLVRISYLNSIRTEKIYIN